MNQALSFPWYIEGSQGSYKCIVDLTLELYVPREGPEEFLDHGWALLLGPNLAAPLGRTGPSSLSSWLPKWLCEPK